MSTSRPPHTLAEAQQLLQLSTLITTNIQRVIAAWAEESTTTPSSTAQEHSAPTTALPSPALHDAQCTLIAATGKLTELIAEPSVRVLELGCQYWESRALYIAAERRVPDLLARMEEQGRHDGVTAAELSSAVGIEGRKLERVMRCLCSGGVFREVGGGGSAGAGAGTGTGTGEGRFANNRVSRALVGNEGLRAYVLLFGADLYTSSDHLPSTLLSPTKGPSYQVEDTAFQDAVGTTKPRWEWLEEKVPREQLGSQGPGYPGLPGRVKPSGGQGARNGLVSRPELEVFGLAMLGGGMVFGAAHAYDYPWGTLGEATVVDVGGGVGGFDLQLSKLYPKLNFVIQDRAPVLQQAEHTVWPQGNPSALAAGRVKFMQHDFFQQNPVQGAAVYWLRYILHDWSDSYCIQILSAIVPSMSAESRILICDQVMNTTLGCPELSPAPEPLPKNYGWYTRYSHSRDLAMMGIINGIERTPEQLRLLVEQAGLRIEKIWECRSQVGIVELRKV